MRKPAIIAVILAVTATVAVAAVNSKQIGTITLYGWEAMEVTHNFTRYVVSGGSPEIKSTDGRFYAKADKMTVELNKAPKGQKLPADQSSIKDAEFTGDVVFSLKPEPGRYIKGAGAKLKMIGAEQKAVLDGAGKTISVEVMDPEAFAQPTTIQGEEIHVNMKRKPAPDEWRIKVQSSSGKSHISVTPKPKSESK